MPLTHGALLGMSMRFHVVVDDIDLGGWKSCRGLSVQFENEQVYSGGNYAHPTILPTKMKYSTVSLQRAMTTEDSARVQSWLGHVASKWYGGIDDYGDRTARITLMDAKGGPVCSWSLRNVYPVSWKGPELDATGNAVALETLDLVHEGFL